MLEGVCEGERSWYWESFMRARVILFGNGGDCMRMRKIVLDVGMENGTL